MENLEDNKLVTILVRGDREINEIAVRKALSGAEVKFAEEDLIHAAGIYPGYGSLLGVDLDKVHLLVDESIVGNPNLVVGANKKDYHVKNWNFDRCFQVVNRPPAWPLMLPEWSWRHLWSGLRMRR